MSQIDFKQTLVFINERENIRYYDMESMFKYHNNNL